MLTNQIINLLKLRLNMDLFYCIDITQYQITLQGFSSKELLEEIKTYSSTLDYKRRSNGYRSLEGEIKNIHVRIVFHSKNRKEVDE